MHDAYQENARALGNEIAWLRSAMLAALRPPTGAPETNGPESSGAPADAPFGAAGTPVPPESAISSGATGEIPGPGQIPPPELPPGSWYARFVAAHELDGAERLVFILALLPDISPETLDAFAASLKSAFAIPVENAGATPVGNAFASSPASRLGGVYGKQHRGFIPTVQTALLLLAGSNLFYNQAARQLFHPQGKLLARNILFLGPRLAGEPLGSAPLFVEPDAASYVTTGFMRPPDFNENFPARLLHTRLEWPDLILPFGVRRELEFMEDWLRHGHEVISRFRHARQGFKALFHGPPGTGKTLAVSLLGKKNDLPVYRVDISQTVSKYIGETEKALERLFSRAERLNWILFFDEADALFSKRGDARSANDRYANQNTAYLLQRLEDYAGMVVLASNLRDNLDPALSRRLDAVVYFPRPDRGERERIWEKTLAGQFRMPPGYNPADLAAHDLSGGEIINIVRRLALLACKNGNFSPDARTVAEVLEQVRPERTALGQSSFC